MKRIEKGSALGGRFLFNVLAKDADNAKEIWEASEGYAVIGMVLKDYSSMEEAYEAASDIKKVVGMVSVGLGGGDSTQWKRVVEVALRLDPGHINQVFPATGYTIGALQSRGFEGNVVNALVSPSGTPGQVVLSTGPLSEKASVKAVVPCEVAFRMIKEVGGVAVKAFPIEGDKRLPELSAIAKATKQAGLPILELTGGITVGNVERLLLACMEDGPEMVIPHVHSSIIDKETKRTDPDKVAELVQIGKRILGLK
jgi:2-dehydro-3-deoxy-phosphogluconate aldolase